MQRLVRIADGLETLSAKTLYALDELLRSLHGVSNEVVDRPFDRLRLAIERVATTSFFDVLYQKS